MKLESGRFAVAVANVWAAVSLICALTYKAAPAAYTGGANFLLHSDMFRATRVVSWGELVLAAVAWWVLAALLAGAAATLYNRSVRA